MTFQDFKIEKRLLNTLADLGLTQPTPIQEKVFSVAMSGADVCGIAQTGTGKTLAYLLPLLNTIKYSKTREPQAVVLVPTRELVVQVTDTIRQLAQQLSLAAAGIFGGVNINTQRLQLQEGFDILVATPGRFYDLAVTGAFKTKSIKKLVIDEFDEMLNLGFRAQLRNIFDLLPERRQNLLFSATMPEEVEALLTEYFNDPVRVEAAPAGTPVERIVQTAFAVPNFHTKVNLLRLLLKEEDWKKVLVFTGSKRMADDLYERIEPEFAGTIGLIHSNKEQNYRMNTVRKFHEGEFRVLIATDIVARGIDVSEVSHVINFDLPDEPGNYIHRIGRTGRADRDGNAISFITPRDAEAKAAIEELMNFEIPVSPLPEEVEVSTLLTDDEIPKVAMRELSAALPKEEGRGAAFHEKLAKNKKVNKRVSRKEQMMLKYGKPKTRGKKRK